MKKIELLAPAGDLKRLKIAVMYGADAVYIGGKQFSLRSRASNFSIDDIAEAVRFADSYGARVHVTCNILPHEDDLDGISEYLQQLESVGVTAVIVASYSIMKLAKQVAPKLEVHVSTQHSSTNSSGARFWQQEGMDRVVLARECTLEDIKETARNTTMPLEVFIHGGMCISYSGRCTLSNNMTTRDANRGGCAQSCRWKYRLFDGKGPLYEEDRMFSMSSKDLCAIDYIKELIDNGITSMKIEGRMKSEYYLATVVRTYRLLIDEIYEKGMIPASRMQWYLDELAKAENRCCAVGFYAGMPKSVDHLYGVNGSGVTQEFIAYVLNYDESSKTATIEVRNNFASGIECEAFGPHTPNQKFIMGELLNKDGEVVDVARTPMQILHTNINLKLSKHDMIRKVIFEKEEVF